MINKAIIIPTGDELKSGVILDTDSPMIMQVLLNMNSNCTVIKNEPILDKEDLITDCIKGYINDETDLIVLIGGSGGGHRYSSSLGKDYTHSSIDLILNNKFATELYGKNGHLWSKLICGVSNNTLLINVPGPYQEAKAAIEAFKVAYEEDKSDLGSINKKMAEAVKSQYFKYKINIIMENKMQDKIYESFLTKILTKDKNKVIVGGFCPKGKKHEACLIYKELNDFNLGKSKDEYLIDYSLAEAIKKLSPKWIPIIGAAISIDGVKNRTGGIIGRPIEQYESADEEIEEISKGIYLLSFPGGPGVAYIGTINDGLQLKHMILEYKSEKYTIDEIINKLNEITDLYILVEDGSGFMNCGGIYISDDSGKYHETFNDKI